MTVPIIIQQDSYYEYLPAVNLTSPFTKTEKALPNVEWNLR
jgi:hypothetical protein